MAFTAQRAEQIVLKSFGVTAPSVGTVREIINSTLSWIENCREWYFLSGGQTTLSLRAGLPYVELPVDVRNINAYSATRALVNTLEPTSQHELIRLRAQRAVTSTLHFWAALEYVPPGLTNLLVRTEDFSDSEWVTQPVSNGDAVPGTITANNAVSPLSTEQTATLLRVTSTAGAQQYVAQRAHYSQLTAGEYVWSVYVKKDTGVAHGSDLTKIRLDVPGGTSQVTGHIDWSGSAPAFAVVPGETAGTLTAVGSELGPDGWIRVWGSFSYAVAEGESQLECQIHPVDDSTANTGGVWVFGGQLERSLKSRFSPIASVSSVAPTPYAANRETEITASAPPRPALGLWPVPQSDQADVLSISYARSIPRIGNDTDEIQIPEWMDGLFVDALQRVARGWEDFDTGGIAERVEPLRNSRLFDDAEDRDSDMMPSYGPMNSGWIEATRGGWINWDTGRASALP